MSDEDVKKTDNPEELTDEELKQVDGGLNFSTTVQQTVLGVASQSGYDLKTNKAT